MSSLEARGLEVSYGGIRAVKGIDLTVRSGELVCLIGANGAGKTTTLKSLCGMLAPSHGEVLYEGVPIAGRPSYELVRRGISMVPEGRGIFGRLTLEENLRIGGYTRRDHPAHRGRGHDAAAGGAECKACPRGQSSWLRHGKRKYRSRRFGEGAAQGSESPARLFGWVKRAAE